MNKYLQTAFYGPLPIVDRKDLVPPYDRCVDVDIIGEWEYWELTDGELVAVESIEED